jgi:hypothetical protein
VVYDFFVWLFGSGITALVYFLPVQPVVRPDTLIIDTRLNNPVTAETRKLIGKGFTLGIEYHCSVIINESKTYERLATNAAFCSNESLFVNGAGVADSNMQQEMGHAVFRFFKFRFDPGDEMTVYVKASIAQDSVFAASTGLKTGILWNYYEPRFEKRFVFTESSGFVPKR